MSSVDDSAALRSLGVLLCNARSHALRRRGITALGPDNAPHHPHQEPPRPSTGWATYGRRSLNLVAASQRRNGRAVRGDLDWIVMKCLEKDRTRRYDTASNLAADVQRHLDHEPIAARPPGRLYRFRKLVRRNKGAFAALAAIALVLCAGVGVSVTQALRARRGEASANAALAELRNSAPVFAARLELAYDGQHAAAMASWTTPSGSPRGHRLSAGQPTSSNVTPLRRSGARLSPSANSVRDTPRLTRLSLCRQLDQPPVRPPPPGATPSRAHHVEMTIGRSRSCISLPPSSGTRQEQLKAHESAEGKILAAQLGLDLAFLVLDLEGAPSPTSTRYRGCRSKIKPRAAPSSISAR